MKTGPRFIAVFPDAEQVSQYVTNCRVVLTMMTGNAWFPTPTPPLQKVSDDLDTLETDEQSAQQGGKGTVEKRDLSLSVVKSDMRLLKAYVQNRSDGRPEAKLIIESAGMIASSKAMPTKDPVSAKHGAIPGMVVLDAKALPRPVMYYWQMSKGDQESWTDIAPSFTAKVTVDGLTPATVYYFRLRTQTREGLSAFGQVISIIVH